MSLLKVKPRAGAGPDNSLGRGGSGAVGQDALPGPQLGPEP